jgi:cell division septation protein DedD
MAAYNRGVTAYQAGKFAETVVSMNTALQAGVLTSNLLAKALYYRGAASQQQGKPGQAISDLTSALWLKGGLDETERAEAARFRSAAYRDAGLAEGGEVASGSSSQGSSANSPVKSGLSGEGTSEQASGLGGIGNLFGNLFGGSKPAPPQPPPATTAVTPPVQASPAAPTGPEVLPWASGSGVASAAPPTTPSEPATGAPKPHKVAANPGAKAGSYRIQVAAVKSRDEASAIISKVQALGGAVAAAGSSVDEATFGSMGTFYRVRVGPFPTAAATREPCAALKASGLDCLVTAK